MIPNPINKIKKVYLEISISVSLILGLVPRFFRKKISKIKRNTNEQNKKREIENLLKPKKSRTNVTLPKYVKERIGQIVSLIKKGSTFNLS